MKWVIGGAILVILIALCYWATGKLIDAVADAIFEIREVPPKKPPPSQGEKS